MIPHPLCRRGHRLVGALLLSYCCVASAAAAPYTFTKVVDDSGTFGSVMSMPTINARGVAVFYGADGKGEGIFVGSGGPVTAIASEAGNPAWGFSTDAFYGPKINDSGRAAFVGNRPDEDTRVFSGAGGPLTTIAGPPGYSITQGIPAINNTGTVAFAAFSSLPGVGGGIFVGNGGPVSKIAPDAGPFNGIDSRLAINDSGQVAFEAADTDGKRFLYRADTVGATVIAPLATSPITGFGTPDMNDAGVVAFVGEVGPFDVGIYKGDGQAITTVVGAASLVRGFAYHGVAINNVGNVAFYAAEANGTARGIFTGPDPVADKVIRFGDPLFGATLSIAEVTHGALNDGGQIAFRYQLSDGTRGIAIATPVPEPMHGTLGALAATACLARRRRSPL